MKREEVYEIIDGERDYQNSRWGKTLSGNRLPGPMQNGGDRSIDEFVTYIVGYADDLIHEASHFADSDKKLAIIRKIAGLCVACMEQHGVPPREVK